LLLLPSTYIGELQININNYSEMCYYLVISAFPRCRISANFFSDAIPVNASWWWYRSEVIVSRTGSWLQYERE